MPRRTSFAAPRFRPRAVVSVALVAASLALAGAPAPAQTVSPPPPLATQRPERAPAPSPGVAMSFPQAVAYARAHQPLLAAAQARVTAARADVEIPRAQWLPYVGATAQLLGATANNSSAVYATSNALDLPRVGGTPALANAANANWTPYASTLAAVGARQEVFDFGRIAAQIAAADARVAIATTGAEAVWLGVRYGVEEAFDAVFAARAVLAAAQDAYARAAVHRDLAHAWVAQGLRSRIELDRAEADLARYDAARIRAGGGVESAQAVLAVAVGYPAPRLDAAGDIPPAPALPSLDDAFRVAAARDPRILEVLARLRAQQAQTRAIEAEARPNVRLTGAISGRAGGAPVTAGELPGRGFAPVVPNWDVGVVLDWPLFDATIGARARASRRGEDAMRSDVDAAREAAVAVIEQAWVDAQVAARAAPSLQRAVDAARANYEQADARFRQGLGSSVELADAEALRADAEVQLALGSFEIARTRAQFSRAIAEGL